MRRPSLRTLAAALVATGLVLAGLGYWGSSRLQARASAELVHALGEASGTRASLKSLELSLWRRELVARGVELAQGSRVLLRAAELRGGFTLAAAYAGRLQLSAIELGGVQLRLTAADLERFAAAPGEGPAVDRLRLLAADVAIDFGTAGTLRMPRADLALERTGSARALTLARAPAQWLRDGRTLARAQLGLQCRLTEAGARFSRAIDCRPTLDGLTAGESSVALPPLELGWNGERRALEARLKLEQPALAASLELTLGAGGALRVRARELRVGPAASSALAVQQLTAAGELRVEDARWIAERLRIELAHGALTGRAELGADGKLTLELDSEQFDFADLALLAGTRVSGRGKVRLRARPAPDAPALEGSIALADAAVGGVALGALSAELALDRSLARIRIARAQVVALERQLSASGAELEFDAAGLAAARAELTVERLPLAELYRSIGAAADPMLARLQARAAGTAQLDYRRGGGPAELALDLSLQLTAARFLDYPFDRGVLRARVALPDVRAGMAAGRLELSQLALSAGGGELELAGKLDRGTLAFQLATRGRRALPLASWPWLRDHAPHFSGGFSVRGALSGTSSRPRADLALAIDALAFRGEPLGSIGLGAALADGPPAAAGCSAPMSGRGWRICGAGLAARLQVDLTLSDAPDRALRGEIALERLPLRPFLPLSAAGKPTDGTLSATLAFTGGGLAEPERVSGRARVRELAVGEGDARLANTGPFELRLEAGALELRGAVLEGREARVALSAAGALGKSPRVIADGTIAAGVFTRTTEPFVKAFGDVALRLQWNLGETPAVTGRVDVRDLVVRIGTTQVRNLRGSLAVAGERVTLDGVAAELGGGTLAASGVLGLRGLRLASYDLAWRAERVSLEPEPLVDVELDAQNRLRWTGGTATPELSGHVKLKRLSYRKQLHPESLTQLGSRRSGPAGEDRVLLDLTVEHEQPLRIRNSLIDGELSSAGEARAFKVLGSDRRIGLIGELAVTRGRLMFQGDQFRVQHGRIEFRDPGRIAPAFDLLAIAERPRRPEAKVVLSARGTDTAFDVDVRCEAPAELAPPPFQCHYRGARMACDALDQLVALFVCNAPPR